MHCVSCQRFGVYGVLHSWAIAPCACVLPRHGIRRVTGKPGLKATQAYPLEFGKLVGALHANHMKIEQEQCLSGDEDETSIRQVAPDDIDWTHGANLVGVINEFRSAQTAMASLDPFCTICRSILAFSQPRPQFLSATTSEHTPISCMCRFLRSIGVPKLAVLERW